MQLVTYLKDDQQQLAILVNGILYDADSLHSDLPVSMSMFLNYWDDMLPVAKAVEQRIKDGIGRNIFGIPYKEATILAPIPHPSSCRTVMLFDNTWPQQGAIEKWI